MKKSEALQLAVHLGFNRHTETSDGSDPFYTYFSKTLCDICFTLEEISDGNWAMDTFSWGLRTEKYSKAQEIIYTLMGLEEDEIINAYHKYTKNGTRTIINGEECDIRLGMLRPDIAFLRVYKKGKVTKVITGAEDIQQYLETHFKI
jgi:hypothetical protein